MGLREFQINGAEGYKINLSVYETEKEEVKGSVLLLHGMAEYHKRYALFIQALNDRGFDVYSYDHRGHGVQTPKEKLGFFAPKDGDELVIEDAVAAMKYVYENKRSAKCALFGHSMGSIISRNVIQRFDKMDCVILSGTAYQPDFMCAAGKVLGNVVGTFCGKEHTSPFLNHVMFESKVYLRDCKRTNMDWLTKDEKIVDAYLADPYCGFVCSASFYRDLGSLTDKAKKGMDKTRRDLPILLAAGDCDPVGGFGKDVTALCERYKGFGFSNVSLKLYEGDRHELLNELDKEKVTEDFIQYFEMYM